MRRLMAASALIVASACGSSPSAPSVPLDLSVVLAPGQAVSIEGTRVQLRFDRVDGDSRCPADALCIWGGDAVVQITVIDNGQSVAYDLHTGDLRPVTHHGLTIALEQLQPYPFSSGPIAPADYRATLRVTN